MTTYKDAGVDIALGEKCSRLMHEAAAMTWENRRGRFGEVTSGSPQSFSGMRYMRFPYGHITATGSNCDGVGTKAEIAQRYSSATNDFTHHHGIAHDLLAMICDDAAMHGAEPYHITNVLDVNRLHEPLIAALAHGMVEAARNARIAVINGEIAELGDLIGGYGKHRYLWSGTCQWAAREANLIHTTLLSEGDTIIALREKGLRSNGYTLARTILQQQYGKRWHEKLLAHEKEMAQELLLPSTIYCSAINELTGGYTRQPWTHLSGAAHITGGGIPSKLGRTLRNARKTSETTRPDTAEPETAKPETTEPKTTQQKTTPHKHRLGANLEDLFEPCTTMLRLQEIGNVSDQEAYCTWNMGNGMLLITQQPDEALRKLASMGIEAKASGIVTNDGVIRIRSKGAWRAKTPVIEFPVL